MCFFRVQITGDFLFRGWPPEVHQAMCEHLLQTVYRAATGEEGIQSTHDSAAYL